MKIIFLGASEEVTGSGYLVETEKHKFLVDFGMFQGGNRKEVYEKNLKLGFDPKEIDFVFLTHCHIDHSGRLPILIKNGFQGEVFATHSTIELAKVVLLDSAKIQNENYKSSLWHFKEGDDFLEEPIYSEKDVKNFLKLFKKMHFRKKIKVGKSLEVEFFEAGHILGASSIQIFIEGRSITFSGDIGRSTEMIVPNPISPKKSDFLIVESTYGDRDHKNMTESETELLQAIKSTINSGGNVLIPSFAIDRTQEILMMFDKFSKEKILNVPVILDSPMGSIATEIYKTHIAEFSQSAKDFAFSDRSMFWFPELRATKNFQDSLKSLNRTGQIIIAGSGMCTGGRILNHLKQNLPNPKSSVCFIGFQAEGTLGREILDGKKEVSIFGEKISVNAKIFTINGFSAHAGKTELINWVSKIKNLQKIFITHGENDQRNSLKKSLQEKLNFPGEIIMPKRFDIVNV